MVLSRLWRSTKERLLPARRVTLAQSDELPEALPRRGLVLVREGQDNWCIGMKCPCGCGQRVELPLILEADPKWALEVDVKFRPTLRPSVWLKDGCRSHFLVKAGKVVWV